MMRRRSGGEKGMKEACVLENKTRRKRIEKQINEKRKESEIKVRKRVKITRIQA